MVSRPSLRSGSLLGPAQVRACAARARPRPAGRRGRAGGTEPGSFLLFPEYDNRPGQLTFLTITNVNTVRARIHVHLNYVDSVTCLTRTDSWRR